MKKTLLLAGTLLLMGLVYQTPVSAQETTARKKQTIDAKSISQPSPEADKLKRPENDKNPKPETKNRGDVYGSNYSDVVIDNYTGYSLDIYVGGSYRGSVAAYDKRVTWAVPGNNTLYAKAVFNDGSYIYWGPSTVYTGYVYTWKLTH